MTQRTHISSPQTHSANQSVNQALPHHLSHPKNCIDMTPSHTTPGLGQLNTAHYQTFPIQPDPIYLTLSCPTDLHNPTQAKTRAPPLPHAVSMPHQEPHTAQRSNGQRSRRERNGHLACGERGR